METYYSNITSILLIFGVFATRVKSDVYSDLTDFVTKNGFTFVNLVTMDTSLNHELIKCIKAFEATPIRFRILDTSKIDLNLDFHSDALLLISNGQADYLQSDLQIIQSFKIKKSILFFPLGKIQDGLLENALEQMERNSLFYITYTSNNQTEYKQVITMTNNTIGTLELCYKGVLFYYFSSSFCIRPKIQSIWPCLGKLQFARNENPQQHPTLAPLLYHPKLRP